MTRQQIEQEIDAIACDGELLAFEYAVSPDNTVHCRDDYSTMEWEELVETDVALFARHSAIGRMHAFMLINAGLSPAL